MFSSPSRFWPPVIAGIFLACAAPTNGQAQQWPQWRGPQRDGVLRHDYRSDEFPENGFELLWEAPLGPGYTSPVVADDRVFVMDRIVKPEQQERVVCFDAVSGNQLWEHTYDCRYVDIGYQAGPRASVTVDGSRAFSLGAMGHLKCFDVGGGVLWEKDLNEEYEISKSGRMPIWGMAAAPLVYDDLLIVQVGGPQACLVAFEKKSGEEVWRALNDRAQYSSPILVQQNGNDVVVLWSGDSVAGIAPRDGQVYWRFPFRPRNMPIGVATPLVKDNQIFVTSFYDGSLMLRLLPDSMSVEKVWMKVGNNERRTQALHSIISTPVWIGEYIYGVDSYGEFRCLDARTGDRVWEDLSAVPKARWSTIHFVQFPDQESNRVWMFNERGELILGKLSAGGFVEQDRTTLIQPTRKQLNQRDGVCWTHPAFTEDLVIVRNDEKIKAYRLDD